jgi:uncharacterized protein YjdB
MNVHAIGSRGRPSRRSSLTAGSIGSHGLRRLALIGLVAGTFVACEGTEPPVYTLEFPQTTVSLELGELRNGGARLLRDGQLTSETITFTSSAPTVVAVETDGGLRALALGSATVTASAQGQTATLNVSVVAGDPVTLVASPDAVVFDAIGDSRQVTAQGRNRFGMAVTATVTWRSASDAIATVANGLIRSVTRGVTQVTATAGSVNAVVQVSVAPAITTVVMTPASPVVRRAETVQLSARANDRLGAQVSGATIVWSSDNTDIATVDQNGLVRGVGLGTTVIRASATAPTATGGTSSPVVGTLTVRVEQPSVARVTVTPATLSIIIGTNGQLTAQPFDAENVPLAGRTVTWSSNATSVVSVDNNGLVSGLAIGSATITATSEGRTGTSVVTVTSSPIATPTIISAVPTPTTVQLTSSAYVAPENELHSSSEWQVDEAGQNWTTLVGGSGESTELTSKRVTGLASSTSYQARVRYRGSQGTYSAFSPTVFFTTTLANRPPATPVLTIAGVTQTAATFDGSPFSDPDPGDGHRLSEWQLDLASGNFSTVVRSSGESMQNLTTWTVTGLTPNTAYQVRVRYRDRNYLIAVDGVAQFTGADGWSEWSVVRFFTTPP